MAVQSRFTTLGAPLPELTLPDLDGRPVVLDALRAGRPLVVVFSCNHCPYVRHIELALAGVAGEFPDIPFVAIASNDTTNHPEDAPPGLRDQLERTGWPFGYLLDAEQQAALAFGAACTPDFFVYDAAGELAYRGAFDRSTPRNGEPLTGELLREALRLIESGASVPLPHRPAMGCGIKWLPGNEPAAVSFI